MTLYGIGAVLTFMVLTIVLAKRSSKIEARMYREEYGILVFVSSILWPGILAIVIISAVVAIPVSAMIWVHDKLDDYVRSKM
jgi:hypothetical protein